VVESSVESSKKKEKMTSIVFPGNVHYLRTKAGLVDAVSVSGIMFICGVLLRFAGTLKSGLSLDQLQQI